jgi:hypothetical protein
VKLTLNVNDAKHKLLYRALLMQYVEYRRSGEHVKAATIDELLREVIEQMPFQSKL